MSDLPARDEAFERQAARFALRATCEACAHFVEERGACAHGYPNHAHRDAARGEGRFVFCKEFELG